MILFRRFLTDQSLTSGVRLETVRASSMPDSSSGRKDYFVVSNYYTMYSWCVYSDRDCSERFLMPGVHVALKQLHKSPVTISTVVA